MDLRVMVVGVVMVACGLWMLKAIAASWQRARSIDVGGVSTQWLVEQRVEKIQDY